MMTVHEVSKRVGVSVRTLHYYDEIGLLCPNEVTESNYRLYDGTALERLQQILFFRELEFPLKDIKEMLESENFDREEALKQQITLLRMKRKHLDGLIDLALEIQEKGMNIMDFNAFDKSEIDAYTKEAKERWGNKDAYQEFEQKTAHYGKADWDTKNKALIEQFTAFGKLRDCAPESEEVQAQVAKLQQVITDTYYTCTKEILTGLGQMYVADERFTKTIDTAGGAGTTEFVSKAIEIYCQ
jgi:DNA-binding transcriptional MerR regulator